MHLEAVLRADQGEKSHRIKVNVQLLVQRVVRNTIQQSQDNSSRAQEDCYHKQPAANNY